MTATWRYRTGKRDDSTVCTGIDNDTSESHRACTGAITVGKAIHSESEDSKFQEEDIHVQVSRSGGIIAHKMQDTEISKIIALPLRATMREGGGSGGVYQ